MIVDIRDLIACFKFGDDRLRGFASDEGQILLFPIDFDGRPYNTLTLPCERVISPRSLRTAWVFRVGLLNDARQIILRLTPVAIATKFVIKSAITPCVEFGA